MIPNVVMLYFPLWLATVLAIDLCCSSSTGSLSLLPQHIVDCMSASALDDPELLQGLDLAKVALLVQRLRRIEDSWDGGSALSERQQWQSQGLNDIGFRSRFH